MLHSVFVKRREDHQVFDQAFRLFWRSRELVEKMIAMFSPVAMGVQAPGEAQTWRDPRSARRCSKATRKSRPPEDKPIIDIDARETVSGNEVLRQQDFAQMTALELSQAKRAIAELSLPFDQVETRRYKPSSVQKRIDPRATMRAAMRTGGDLILPRFRQAPEGASAAGDHCRYFRIDEPVHADLPAFHGCDSARSGAACTHSCSAQGSPTSQGRCATRIRTRRVDPDDGRPGLVGPGTRSGVGLRGLFKQADRSRWVLGQERPGWVCHRGRA